MLIREEYLQKLINSKDLNLIKVINPFLFVKNESLFKKVDDTTFTLEGDSATDFIY